MKPGIEYWSCEQFDGLPAIRVTEVLPSGKCMGFTHCLHRFELEHANFNLLAFKIEYVAAEFRRFKAGVLPS
jgi:hypothetical protein